MRVRWYCGCYVGPAKWQNTETYEPDECCAEGEIEVDEEDWKDEDVVMECPECGAELAQFMDHFSKCVDNQ